MRTVTYLIAGAVLGGSLVSGEPLQKATISDEAKWVAHLDLEAFSQSTIGQYFLEKGKAEMAKQNDMPVKVDIDVVIADLKSITAYGYELQDQPEENSVLVLKTGERLSAIVDAILANMEVSGQETDGFESIPGKAFPTYLLGDELYVSMPSKNFFVGSKSFEQIERAMDVIEGKRSSLEGSDSTLVGDDPRGFFLFASAEGLNEIDGIPPQARMLQQATGAQFSLGEIDGDIRTRLRLATESATVSDQLSRIINGMLALASFAQVENESVSTIVRNAKVQQADDFVSVDLSYSAEKILAMVKSLVDKGEKMKSDLSDHGGNHDNQSNNSSQVVVDDPIGGDELGILNVDAKSDDGNLPRHAADGDMDTRWSSRGRGQWIRFELDSPSLVRELQIAWLKGNGRKYRFTVQSSPDGVKWSKVIDRISSGNTDLLESFNIPDTGTKWIRIWCNGNSENSFNNISEIRFLGEANYEIPAEGETVAR